MVEILTKSPFAHFVTLLHHTVRPPLGIPTNQPTNQLTPPFIHLRGAEREASRKKPNWKILSKFSNPGLRISWAEFSAATLFHVNARSFYTFWHPVGHCFLPFLAETWAIRNDQSLDHLILNLSGLGPQSFVYLWTAVSTCMEIYRCLLCQVHRCISVGLYIGRSIMYLRMFMEILISFSVKFPIVNKFFTNKSFALINNLIFHHDLSDHLPSSHMFQLASLYETIYFVFFSVSRSYHKGQE